MNKAWKLKGEMDSGHAKITMVFGMLFIISLWHFITWFEFVPRNILPNPIKMVEGFKELVAQEHKVYGNVWDRLAYSVRLNLIGYAEATVISVTIGFILGLFAPVRAFLGVYLNAARYVPLTATTGIMIAWFGIHDTMKVQFLAIGIIVYMIPTVASRVQETLDIHLQTAGTLGATPWQKIYTIFFPDVLRRVSSDIITLGAISWTYINFAEMINNTGGIGSLIWETARQSKYERMWSLLFLVVLVAFVQDQLGKMLDRIVFPDKYTTTA